MDSVDVALARVWPAVLRADRVILRPVTHEDASLVREALTDARVRAFLGGPASEGRVAARQREYPQTPGVWAVVPATGTEGIGLVTITSDNRCPGRAEIAYQMLPSAWGQGFGREAVGTAISWWTAAAPAGGPLVAITQERNTASRRLLESLGLVLVDTLFEYGQPQCLYTPADTEETVLRWSRLLDERREEAERRRGAQERATAAGSTLPQDLSALAFEDLARRCPARHGAHGRICAHVKDHVPDLHLGRAADGAWIAWSGSDEE
ncbi:GNAT family N-acetyltransferase [Kitasatospora sp. NPDC051164]|uniref:GNAT family N-acetyltransferase n=1 Tax=Kitasatospora sp. NPDC051164 TaxID=3364055 RepID=UPI0037AC0C8C